MSDPTTGRHLPLHPEAFRILLALRRGESHGYALVKELERDPDRSGRILPANLYRKIRTLLQDGLIREAPRQVDPDTDDQRRRYFGTTELGEAVAKAEISRLHGLLAEAGGPLRQ